MMGRSTYLRMFIKTLPLSFTYAPFKNSSFEIHFRADMFKIAGAS